MNKAIKLLIFSFIFTSSIKSSETSLVTSLPDELSIQEIITYPSYEKDLILIKAILVKKNSNNEIGRLKIIGKLDDYNFKGAFTFKDGKKIILSPEDSEAWYQQLDRFITIEQSDPQLQQLALQRAKQRKLLKQNLQKQRELLKQRLQKQKELQERKLKVAYKIKDFTFQNKLNYDHCNVTESIEKVTLSTEIWFLKNGITFINGNITITVIKNFLFENYTYLGSFQLGENYQVLSPKDAKEYYFELRKYYPEISENEIKNNWNSFIGILDETAHLYDEKLVN